MTTYDEQRRSEFDEQAEAGPRPLADALVKAEQAQAAVGAAPDDLILRQALAKSTRSAQAEYLAQVSPAGARAWQAASDANAEPDLDPIPEALTNAACVGIPNDALNYRTEVAKSTRDDQLQHLRSVSPSAALAWERANGQAA
jgi:hypothetical protein